MKHVDFVVGPRFHGVMLAMQAGTPGGVIAHDSRTLEMCETMAIPVRTFNDVPSKIDPSDIPSLFNFDAAAYSAKRRELVRQYSDMLIAAGVKLKLSTGLGELRDSVPGSPIRSRLSTNRSEAMALAS